eukprot:m.384793 g.384793  ORF g.384793 m.384793 type:complete len:419 (-) comp21000_c0_seq2:1029-2285(-)
MLQIKAVLLSLCILSVVFSVTSIEAKKSEAKQPHLVFILADDQGWNNIGLHNPDLIGGNTKSVAAEGIRFTNHHVFKFCSPTRSSFVSGRWPIHVNQENSATRQRYAGVPLNMTTISEKLAGVGYKCHHFGKWHVGQATMAHTPVGRSFETSLTFFNFGEDHYTQLRGGQAFFEGDPLALEDPPNCQGVDLWNHTTPAYGQNGTYGGYLFTNGAVEAINNHDPTTPLFLFAAFQNLHPPLEVPQSYVDVYPKNLRTTINGMATFLDESVGNLTQALKQKGLWDNLLLVYSADNGGYLGNGGDSRPFRGGTASAAAGCAYLNCARGYAAPDDRLTMQMGRNSTRTNLPTVHCSMDVETSETTGTAYRPTTFLHTADMRLVRLSLRQIYTGVCVASHSDSTTFDCGIVPIDVLNARSSTM